MSQIGHGYYIRDSTIGGQMAGKGFFSNRAFKSGEPIITITRPLMASLESERLKDTCANCYVWTEGSTVGSRIYVKQGITVQMCAGCKRFRYCSKVYWTIRSQQRRSLTITGVPERRMEPRPQARM